MIKYKNEKEEGESFEAYDSRVLADLSAEEILG